MADIANDEERRAALVGRECGNVAASLMQGAFKGVVKGGGAALAVAGAGATGRRGIVRGFGGIDSLLGFANEMGALVEVDSAVSGCAVWLFDEHVALYDIGVLRRVRRFRLRFRNSQNAAKLGEKENVVGSLRATGFFPAFDEGGNLLGCGVRHGAGGGRRGGRGGTLSPDQSNKFLVDRQGRL